MSWPAATFAHQLWWPPGGGRWGDGCKHVFVDVGMNIGVQTRKLFEPAAYPWTQVEERSSNFSFIEAFNDEFGPDRSSNVCAFGIEANPRHTSRLQSLQSCYVKHGWRVAIFTQTAATDFNGTTSFFGDPAHRGNEEWSASMQPHGRSAGKMPKFHVTAVDLAHWIMAHIVQRRLPSSDTHSADTLGTHGRVVLKLDVESAEFAIIPRMLEAGLLCDSAIQFINLEWHFGHLASTTAANRQRARKLATTLPAAMQSQRCSPSRLITMDDDTYTHDSPTALSLKQCLVQPQPRTKRFPEAVGSQTRQRSEQRGGTTRKAQNVGGGTLLPHVLRMREADNLLASGLLSSTGHAAIAAATAAPGFKYRSLAWLRHDASLFPDPHDSRAERMRVLRRYLQLVYREEQLPVALDSDEAIRRAVLQAGWLWNAAPVALQCVHQGVRSFPIHELCRAQTVSAVRPLSIGLQRIWQSGYLTPPRPCCLRPHAQSATSHMSPEMDAAGFHPDNAWVEVLRIGSSNFARGERGPRSRLLSREGGSNGVWFLVTSGTGVFINTGKSLRAPRRQELVAALGIDVSALRGGPGDKEVVNMIEDFVPLCPLVRRRGYTSIQVGNPTIVGGNASIAAPCAEDIATVYPHEFVCCDDECMEPLRPTSACVGRSLLRTGFNASLPCKCLPTEKVLNCQGTAATQLPWPWTSGSEPLFNNRRAGSSSSPRPYGYCPDNYWGRCSLGLSRGTTLSCAPL